MFSRCHRLVLGLDDSSTDSLLFRDGLREHVSTVSESAKTFFLGGGGGGRLVGVAESKAVLSDLLIMKDSLSTTQLQACAL